MTREQLEAENAALRDLLAAISECARAVPQAVYDRQREQLRRAENMLISISVITDPDGTWEWSWGSGQGAAHLRECAAEPVGYRVYEPAQDEMPPEVAAKYSVLAAEHRDTDGETWTTAGLTVAAKAAS